MKKYFFFSFLVLFCFLGSDCKDEPIKPCSDCPQPVDTTSHNFTWQIDTLGDGNSSILYDVAVINDTIAYAVGELYLKDSTGKLETTPYGFAIWNGQKWKLKRIFARYPNSNTPLRPKGIIAFSATDVWFAWGDVFQWDGKSDTVKIHRLTVEVTNPNPILSINQTVNKLWGTSSNNLFGGGERRSCSLQRYKVAKDRKRNNDRYSRYLGIEKQSDWRDGNTCSCILRFIWRRKKAS